MKYIAIKNMSALASAFGLGGFSQGVMGLSSIKSEGSTEAELTTLNKEFGLALQDKRASATLTAFQDPVKAFADYQTARRGVEAAALAVYKKSLGAAEAAGLPTETAIEYAKKRSIAYFQDELELLNLTHPYAETPEGLISLATGARRRDLFLPKISAPGAPAKESKGKGVLEAT